MNYPWSLLAYVRSQFCCQTTDLLFVLKRFLYLMWLLKSHHFNVHFDLVEILTCYEALCDVRCDSFGSVIAASTIETLVDKSISIRYI